MRRFILSLALLFALAHPADATVQSHTTSGSAQTITLNAGTTVLRFNVASTTSIVGITGGTDGRVIYLWNASPSVHITVHHDHSSATTTADRLNIDANGAGGFRYLFGAGIGMAMATYDATSSRWRFVTLEGYNSTGSGAVAGELNVAGNVNATGVITGGNTTLTSSGTTRLFLKPTSATNNGSTLQWQNSAGTSLFSMGPDYYGNTGKDFWLYDGWNGVTNLYANNTGTSYLAFGTSYGGLEYAESVDELRLFATGAVRLRLRDDWAKLSAPMFYQRLATGTAKPTLEAATCGASATQHSDSSDSRGSVTLPAGVTSCKMSFAIPWDIEQSPANGFPICTFTASSGYVTVSALTDHYVTFNASVAGSTVYYHCDGIIDPQ